MPSPRSWARRWCHAAAAEGRAARAELVHADDRGRAARRRDRHRPGADHAAVERGPALSIVLVAVLVVSTLWATAELIDTLIHGGPITNSATELLEAGAVVWLSNCIAFALLFWELDGGGGGGARSPPAGLPRPGLPAAEQPAARVPGWRPRFIDYLYLAFTNATALSPTDVMPLVPWAKIAMTVQSVISLSILALVVARAVNVFS